MARLPNNPSIRTKRSILVTTNGNVKFNGPSLIVGKGVIQNKTAFLKLAGEMYEAVMENPNLRIKFQLDNVKGS